MKDEDKKIAMIGSDMRGLSALASYYAVAAAGLGERFFAYTNPHSEREILPGVSLPSMAGYSKYERHQGSKEMERRRKRLGAKR